MLLAMSDASVLVDMAQTKLLSPMTRLPYEIVAPDFVIEEITRQEETRAIDALVRGKKLTVLTATRDDLRRVEELQQSQARLSFADCSVVVLAERYAAMILTNDLRMRKVSEGKGLTCHGTIWIVRQLVQQNAVGAERALRALYLLVDINPRLPRAECNRLLQELQRASGGSD